METNDVDKVCAKCDTIIEAVTCAQVRRSERVPERILALCIRNVPVTLETQRFGTRAGLRYFSRLLARPHCLRISVLPDAIQCGDWELY